MYGKYKTEESVKTIVKGFVRNFQIKGRDLIGTSLISVTVVRISPDLSIARVYISVFGTDNKEDLLKINQQSYIIRKKLGERIRNQMEKSLSLSFF